MKKTTKTAAAATLAKARTTRTTKFSSAEENVLSAKTAIDYITRLNKKFSQHSTGQKSLWTKEWLRRNPSMTMGDISKARKEYATKSRKRK